MGNISWPDTSNAPVPVDNNYRAALWLLGRHPRLDGLARRIRGVVCVEDGELWLDLIHLADVINGVPVYNRRCLEYERTYRAPSGDDDDDSAYYAWEEAAPKADDTVSGLRDYLVMSSGEVAAVRLLATLASEPTPFKAGYFASMDDTGQRILRDWCTILTGG